MVSEALVHGIEDSFFDECAFGYGDVLASYGVLNIVLYEHFVDYVGSYEEYSVGSGCSHRGVDAPLTVRAVAHRQHTWLVGNR